MGLALPALRYLAQEHKKKAFGKKVLILGRQYVFATFDEIIDMLKKENIEPAKLDPDFILTTNIPNWQNHPDKKKHTSDVAFFALLGSKLYTMDISDYEGADYIQDLNNPIPDELNEMFDVVIDGGTMEHLFNTKQCLENITRMTKTGGRIIHMTVSNNYSGHGFFQFSPDLFYDYYSANNFKNLNGLYIHTPIKSLLSKIYGNPRVNSWDTYELDDNYYSKMFVSGDPAGIYFSAQKTDFSTFNKIPQQGDYHKSFLNNTQTAGKSNKIELTNQGKFTKIVFYFKYILKPILQIKVFSIIVQKIKKIKKYKLLYKKPWGLTYKGKL